MVRDWSDLITVLYRRNVLITGGTGSLGTALCQTFLDMGVQEITVFSRDEKKQADLKMQFPTVHCILGDVRDYNAIRDAVRRQDIVIHAASLKYVDLSEEQPTEYIKTNVIGTLNVINAVKDEGVVQTLIGISTDKSCMPINTYGLTKLLLEKMFIEAHKTKGNIPTKFIVTRYGNVLGTRGSVVVKWRELAKNKQKLVVTDPTMTRFFFTLEEAIDLIKFALIQRSGLIISQKMSAATLGNLAEVMQTNNWEISGVRLGEKHHESLLSMTEMQKCRAVAANDAMYFIYDPLGPIIDKDAVVYTSADAYELSQKEIVEVLGKDGWLDYKTDMEETECVA